MGSCRNETSIPRIPSIRTNIKTAILAVSTNVRWPFPGQGEGKTKI